MAVQNLVRTDIRSIFSLSVPMLASLLLEQLIGLTDIIFLGRVSEISVGAAAIGGIAFFVLTMIAFGYCIASQSLMGQANGRRDYREIGNVFHQSALFLAMMCALIMLALPFCMEGFFNLVVQSDEVRAEAQSYFFWRTIGIGFSFGAGIFRGFFLSILQPKVLTYSSVVMVLSNCILNYFLIFGFGPIPALGIAGAAIASTLAEILTFIFFVIYAVKRKHHQKYGIFDWFGFDKRLQIALFKLGRWMMLQEIVIMSSWFFFFVFVEHMSERSLAISNLVRSVSNLLFLFVHAFGATCGSIGANLLGENRANDIDSMMKNGLKLSFLITAPICLLIGIWPEPVLSLFTNIEELSAAAVTSVRVMLLGYAICIPAVHYFSVFGFLGCTRESLIASSFTSIAYAAYAWVASVSVDDVALVWTADAFYYACLGVFVIYYWRNASWRVALGKEKSPLQSHTR